MKKIIYTIVISILFINTTYAFSIDIDKINIGAKGDSLIKKLDASYKIDIQEFNNDIVYDESIIKYSKELLKITFSDKNNNEIIQELVNNMHFSNDNGFDTLTGSIFIQSFVEQVKEYDIKLNYIKDIKTVVFNDTDRMVFIYLPLCEVNGEEQDVVVAFWLKSNDGIEFKLFYPWITVDEQLDNYYKDLTKSEEQGINIGGTFNQMTTSSNEEVSNEELQMLYDANKDSVVQITGMSSTGSNAYGSGFIIREGIVVTTWSLFLQLLTESNYMFVNDVNGNTYDIVGVVSAQIDYDIVVLKINKEVGKRVVFGDSTLLKNGDYLFTINSKSNNSFMINYGTNIKVNDGRLENMFLLSKEDVGSALFNQNGEVVGFNVADQLYSNLSYANSTDYLIDLQKKLVNSSYSNIYSTKLELFKDNYYLDVNREKTYNKVNNVIWREYSKIGNINENITLDLVKASYVDNILSLRYKNETNGLVDSIYLVSNYTNELVKQGYRMTYNSDNKVIYTNGEYKVIIKDSLDYLVILIMEV